MTLPCSPFNLQVLFSLAMLALGSWIGPAVAGTSRADYDLAISFEPKKHLLNGTARISLQPGTGIGLDLSGLSVNGILLRHASGREIGLPLPAGVHFNLSPEANRRELYISYSARAEHSADNMIDPTGIALTDRWHPLADRDLRFRLQARLPGGFTAITESDLFPLTMTGDTVTADFSRPRRNLHFAAGPYVRDSLEVREGLRVHSLFFPEDRELASPYLKAAAGYLQRYEREIGPFPYKHYVIVANRQPTGLGMPTFTLLGQQVLRLPFIKDTSLGHEILHSWFGSSVEVEPSGGNWCEGLTTFLADHAYRADHGEAAADRKERIINYLSYAQALPAISLSAFRSADHSLPQAGLIRAVGYNRGTLLFNELREMLGAEVFTLAIRAFYGEHSGKSASWEDLQQNFSRAAGRNLAGFFAERLARVDIPELAISDISVNQKGGETHLFFQLEQKTERPFSLQVPIHVTTSSGVSRFIVPSGRANTPVSLTINGLPLQLSIDPQYSFMRKLAAAELPPVWSRFLGADKKLVVLESEEQRNLYSPILDGLADASWRIRIAAEVKSAELSDSSLLFLGLQHPLSRSLFALPDHPATGLTLDVRRHPLNPGQVAVLLSSSSSAETAAASRRLSHYGKYSFLHFAGGRTTRQLTAESESGMQYTLEQLPRGAATPALGPFAAIMAQLDDKRVVYVGETHTSMADHRLQLRIIEALYQKNPDLAIGMEMFPTTSQKALDAYTGEQADLDEGSFLKASRYFQVWRYDYRLYREIMQFAHARHIPVVGLNLEDETVGTVFRTGSVDALPADVKKSLPVDRDLDMPGYAEWLGVMHDMHASSGHGSGSLGGFIQAQALWDETMAENIATHLRQHPGRRMVVLAGSQHSRKDSGIPPRLLRRLPLRQATVLSIAEGSDAENLAEMADYFFVTPPLSLPDAAMMGVVLESQQKGKVGSLRVTGFSPESRADEAGLLKDDILTMIEGRLLQDMDDVRIALLDAGPGQKVSLGIEREGKDGKTRQRMQFSIELIKPAVDRSPP